MKCKFCGNNTKVTNKRESKEGARRRRECLKCKKRFTTYEKPEDKDIIVVKKDGRREHFLDEKLRLGLIRACQKRPVSMEKIDKIVGYIKEKLRKKGKEVKSDVIEYSDRQVDITAEARDQHARTQAGPLFSSVGSCKGILLL